MILFVAIVLVGFTWRLIRRAIVKCLHVVFELTGLTRLYERVWSKGGNCRRWLPTSLRDGHLDGFGESDSSSSRLPVSMTVGRSVPTPIVRLAGSPQTDDRLRQDCTSVQATTRGPSMRDQLRRPASSSSFGRQSTLPLIANWCKMSGSRSSSQLIEPLIREASGRDLQKIISGNKITDSSACPARADHLHLA